jgi:hypothetical protein
VAELLRPLPETAEKCIEKPLRSAPGTEDVVLRVIPHHAAGVFDHVPGARAALDSDGAQTRIHGDIDAVEIVVGAAHVVGKRQEVIGQPEFFGFDVVEGQRVSAAAPCSSSSSKI